MVDGNRSGQIMNTCYILRRIMILVTFTSICRSWLFSYPFLQYDESIITGATTNLYHGACN
ncbi:hypothetical protein KEH51_25490 [[Brevibacterium] frigoritolerans]|uniref:Uncharacterized protein n=1 Tax=Peribacillus frigoritolerans TaxID=450367 RepID=A0A941FL07_9BACI|nr:hypothetical protein [Peribacillus frigoritolerans]